MSTVQQTMRVPGEIQIISTAAYRALSGKVTFLGPLDREYGQLRVFGESGRYTLLLDSSGTPDGMAIRTTTDEGSSLINGKSKPYAFIAKQGYCQTPQIRVSDDAWPSTVPYQIGQEPLAVSRAGTKDTTQTSTNIASFYQQNWKTGGEIIRVVLGGNQYVGFGCWGFFTPTSSPTDSNRYTFFGINNGSTDLQSIKILSNGDVTMLNRLTVPTISATTYENLPAVPPAQLLPLTLDKTNNRVGINQTNPVQALDVVGNGHFTGTLDIGNLAVQNSVIVVGDATFDGVVDARQDVNITKNLHVLGDTTLFRLGVVDSVSAYKYFSGSSFLVGGNSDPEGSVDGVPGSLYMRSDTGAVYVKTLPPGTTGWKELGSGSGDLTPITLDKTNNRVGINQTSPLQALDVTGNAHITGTLDVTDIVVENSLMVAGQGTFEGIFAVDDITCGTLHLGSIINSSKSNVLMYDTTTKEVSYGASPAPDLAPITLDKINNRVGINFATPSYTLGVGGDANLATGGVYRINGDRVLATKASGSTVIVGPTITVPDTSIQSVCIGTDSNVTTNCVSIGYNAGRISPGASTVAIGSEAGKTLQGNSSVAIGCLAGFTNQHANSIILNATGSALNSNGNSRFYVKPVRQDTAAPSLLGYDATTGEITYGVSKGVDVTSTTISFGNPGGSTSEYVNVTLATPGTYEITVEHWYTCNTPITVTSSMVYNCTEGTLSMTGFVASKKFVPSQTVSNLTPMAYAVNNKLLGNSVKFLGISAVSSNASFVITYTISNPQPIPANTFTTYRKTTVVKLS
jgi:hypothetical protein